MYRRCIFCAADLGRNQAVETFSVGRTLAFDAGRGRLWAVCPRCGRWNLAPLEERWEAIETAEREFRGTRLRAHSDNVGLAALPDGTRLIRVGAALPGELAAWRYGRQFLARHREQIALHVLSLTVGPGAGPLVGWLTDVARYGWRGRNRFREQLVPAGLSPTGRALRLPRGALAAASLAEGSGGALLLRVPVRALEGVVLADFADDAARTVLARALPVLNREGGGRREVRQAVDALVQAPSPETFIRQVARRGAILGGPSADRAAKLTPTGLRALEMALHEETERRALEGELAALEAMWREAEEIAAIADRLPDPLETATE